MMTSQKVRFCPFMSFPRKRESSHFKVFWTPVFMGVTTLRLYIELSGSRAEHLNESFYPCRKLPFRKISRINNIDFEV